VLGPYNFRCFAHGVTCDGGLAPTTLGVRTACESNEASDFLNPVADYVASLHAVRPFDDRLAVAGILGKPAPIAVITDPMTGDLALDRTCEIGTTDAEGAFAPTRTDQFLAGFVDPVRTTICDADLSPAIDQITQRLVRGFSAWCSVGVRPDADPTTEQLDPDCSVTEVQHAGTADESRAIVPRCDATASNQPCWQIEPDPLVCTFTDHHLEVAMYYPPETDRTGTRIEAQCRTQ